MRAKRPAKDPKMVSAAHRLVNTCYKHLLAAFPDGKYLKDSQYVYFFGPILEVCNGIIYGKGLPARISNDTYAKYKNDALDYYQDLCTRMAIGAAGPFSDKDMSGKVWASSQDGGREDETTIIVYVAWKIAQKWPARREDDGTEEEIEEYRQEWLKRTRRAEGGRGTPGPHI